MSALYSVLVIAIVAVLLLINSLWLYKAGEPACIDCDVPEVMTTLDSNALPN